MTIPHGTSDHFGIDGKTFAPRVRPILARCRFSEAAVASAAVDSRTGSSAELLNQEELSRLRAGNISTPAPLLARRDVAAVGTDRGRLGLFAPADWASGIGRG